MFLTILTIFEASTSVDDNLHAAGVFLGNEADDIHAGNQIKGLFEVSWDGRLYVGETAIFI